MNRKLQLVRAAVVILAFLPLLVGQSTALFGQGAQQAPGWSNQGNLEDFLNIELRTDVRVFTVMAAATVAGFGRGEEERLDMQFVSRLREDLKGLDPSLRDRLRVMFAGRSLGSDEAQHTAYTSLALLLTGPPDFRLIDNAPEIPLDVKRILGFEELLPEFYRKADIEALWDKYRPDYSRELEAYGPIVKRVISATLQYFRIPARVVLDRSIVIMPDLFGFRNVVHARNLERVYYIVVGPADDHERNAIELQHEYLHFLLDPLVEKQGGQVLKRRTLLTLSEQQPNLAKDFRGRFLLILTESLVEAVLHELHPPADWDRENVSLFRRGLIFTPYFLRALKKYEGLTDVTFPNFLADSLGAISEDEINQDAETILALEKKLNAADQKEEMSREAELAEQRRAVDETNRKIRLFREATEFMGARQWDQAESSLNELLKIDPENGDAMFYLGQIAAQKQDHEAAQEYYRKAEASTGAQPWVKAWSSVRIGRYLAHQGKFAEARQKFEQVIQTGEDFNGARQAAQESLKALPPSKR